MSKNNSSSFKVQKTKTLRKQLLETISRAHIHKYFKIRHFERKEIANLRP